jgi:hypothetical protein
LNLNRILLLASALLFATIHSSFAQWAKTIDCPADRVYRDVRKDAGRQEFCERVLPGSLVVKDGPFRFWFNQDFQGASGNYSAGREVGKWKECDRFGRCAEKDYPAIYPEEKQRQGFKPEIPVSYLDGKYVFDFASCRSTSVSHTKEGKPDLELNIGGFDPSACEVNYLPERFLEGGEEGSYTCKVPYSVGKREIGSLDLITELPKLGLPQYCARFVIRRGPSGMSVNPWIGQGVAQIFTAQYDVGTNGVGIAQARLHFQTSAASRTNRCVVRYDPGTHNLYLLSDQAGKYLGPIAAGGDDSLWNNRCLLSGCSNAQVSGTRLTVQFAIKFNPALFAGQHNMYLEIVDTERHASPAVGYYNWIVPAAQSDVTAKPWPEDRSCPTATEPAFPFD